MNLIIFQDFELNKPLLRQDRRFKHIRRILKASPGDRLRAGILNGSIGDIVIQNLTREKISFSFEPLGPPPALLPIHLICGLPRPQQAKRILRDCTSQGVSNIWFTRTELGEKSYQDSPIWNNKAWLPLVIEGLEQSGGTLIPEIKLFDSISKCILSLPDNLNCITLDNHDSHEHLKKILDSGSSNAGIALVIGSERGWTDTERDLLGKSGFCFGYLGNRILRTDTACISATSLATASLLE
ncbi:16S rRNA (uracil(1498)-N(3))-methyltransferase [bacterium]|nr:16S rRNA (uracil(1498)-N(3))-methyltransferase [bacterium]